MPDISALAAALPSLKAAKDIAEAMIGLRDSAAFQAKLIEFQSKLIDANNASFVAQDERATLLERIRDLEEKVAGFETWDAEKNRYELKEFGRGAFAYTLKPEAQGAAPPQEIDPPDSARKQRQDCPWDSASVSLSQLQIGSGNLIS
jgi:hypothetical protein